ncbi:MAG: hypothetical protein EA397_18625 [Deltaproteobacteria bacterium]|nr:MAG: hypothetical protein EA397_18625 [Deltaproteobacteria bacterium]
MGTVGLERGRLALGLLGRTGWLHLNTMNDDRNERSGPYARLALFALRRRGWVALVCAVIVAVAAGIGLPPKVDNDVMTMLPGDDEVIAASSELVSEGGVDLLTLGVADPESSTETSERLRDYIQSLAEAFERSERVDFVFHQIDPDLAFQIGLLQLDPDDVHELTKRLRGAVALGPALNPVVIQRLLDLGPVTERLDQAHRASLFSADDGIGRLVVRPTGAAQDRAFVMAFYDEVDEILAANPPEAKGLELVYLGGPFRTVPDDLRTITRDLGWTSLLAAVLVLGLVTLAFRDVRATLMVFVPILGANILTLGMVALVYGHLNSFTSAAIPVLVGLGIDFGVHLLGRYRELRGRGASLEGALAEAWERTGPPCVVAGVTSAAGFLALVAAQFRGFSQFGVVLAFGLLTSLALMLVLLPALIGWFDRSGGHPLPGAASEGPISTSTYRLAPLGLMVAVLVTVLFGAVRLPLLSFDFDISSMRAEGKAYADLDPRKQQLAEASYGPAVLTFSEDRQLDAAHRRLKRKLSDHELRHVGRVLSIRDALPRDMARRVAELAELAEVVRHPNLRYVHASPARPMVEALLPLRDNPPRGLTEDDLPSGLVRLLGGGTDERRLLVLPKGNMWDMRNALALLEELREAEPQARVAGSVPVQGLLFHYVMRDVPIVGGLALLLVLILSGIDLRRPVLVVGAMGTLLAGLTWSGVMLELFGVKLSVVNLVGVPILLGIGIDVVIHLLHRLQEEGPGGVRRAWRTTGVASAISTATTVASFGALLLASSRGVRSLGLLVVIGLSTLTIVGALLLPLAWATGWRVTGKAPGDQESS